MLIPKAAERPALRTKSRLFFDGPHNGPYGSSYMTESDHATVILAVRLGRWGIDTRLLRDHNLVWSRITTSLRVLLKILRDHCLRSEQRCCWSREIRIAVLRSQNRSEVSVFGALWLRALFVVTQRSNSGIWSKLRIRVRVMDLCFASLHFSRSMNGHRITSIQRRHASHTSQKQSNHCRRANSFPTRC